METSTVNPASIRAIVQRLHGAAPSELRLEQRRLRGGLEAAAVSRVVARYRDRTGRARIFTCVVKRLTGGAAREARVYHRLVAAHVPAIAPRLLDSSAPAPDETVLYLEAVRPVNAWPWRASASARAVLEQAARLHALDPDRITIAALSQWDYEGELSASAVRTMEKLERVIRRRDLAGLRAGFRAARRLVLSLPEIRRRLLAFAPFGNAPIHGDLHPGNALVRRRAGRNEPVLIDWGRARIGSPLEDVSSWLQCLAGFEPEARRRHDTLLAAYLSARGMEARLRSDLRAAYWLAGASNALSGALLHHLTVMLDERAGRRRCQGALYSAGEWLRVLRRADAHWT